MKGKLIVIEGLDGSGKTTQLGLIREHYERQGTDVKFIKLPDYDSKSSTLVKMYLSGEFGASPQDVNAYAASLFYAVDRFASFNQLWKPDYDAGKLIIADRYTTSNPIYQMTKLPENEWNGYLDWLFDLEYKKLGIPKPDLVIYLDVPPDISQSLMSQRYNGDEERKDIHESSKSFLESCREAALFTAKSEGWRVIDCKDGNTLRPKEDINKQILSLINEEIQN